MNPHQQPEPSNRGHGRWFRPVTLWLPKWRLAVPVVLLLSLLLLWLSRGLNGFLSVSRPVQAEVLVVEGWLPDYALEWAVHEFERGGYDWLIASGGPMELGSLVTGYATYADVAAAALGRLGVAPDRLVTARAESAFRNRTFVSAGSVRDLLGDELREVRGVNVVSLGPHARRSWVVYRKVLGDATAVGVFSVPSQSYDPDRWWASSDGAKSTLAEALGWAYERLFDGGR